MRQVPRLQGCWQGRWSLQSISGHGFHPPPIVMQELESLLFLVEDDGFLPAWHLNSPSPGL